MQMTDEKPPQVEWPQQLQTLMPAISKAKKIVVVTGAGMSAESGIPTFRSAQHALWADYDPQELATPDAWRKDPAKVWAWYEWRRAMVMQAQPNAGHLALAQWGRDRQVMVVTQNVDDLHERAGSEHVIHVHGSLFEPRCFSCHRPSTHAQDCLVNPDAPAGSVPPPHCTHCGDLIRPGVVWFTEAMPETEWMLATHVVKNADLLLVVGTSAVVQPAAQFPRMAREKGIPVLVINPVRTNHTRDVSIVHWESTAAQALPALVDRVLSLG